MAFTEQDKEAMDLAASEAHIDFDSIVMDRTTFNCFIVVGQWWQRWYLKAGHKRLARILLEFVKETEEISD